MRQTIIVRLGDEDLARVHTKGARAAALAGMTA